MSNKTYQMSLAISAAMIALVNGMSDAIGQKHHVPVTVCDRLAAHPGDPQRVASGIPENKVEPIAAIMACRAALRKYPGSGRFHYQIGRAYWAAGQYKSARKNFMIAASYMHLMGHFNLARMYLDGDGGNRSVLKSLKHLTASANKGLTASQNLLGTIYAAGIHVARNDEIAASWFIKAADNGDPIAQSNLGIMYENGWGLPQDYMVAVELYTKAANQQFPVAQYLLGKMYDNGRGVSRDAQKAAEWYRKAAEQGNAQAQFNLGMMYRSGEGIPNDVGLAAHWLGQAARQGHVEARDQLSKTK